MIYNMLSLEISMSSFWFLLSRCLRLSSVLSCMLFVIFAAWPVAELWIEMCGTAVQKHCVTCVVRINMLLSLWSKHENVMAVVVSIR